MGMVNNFSDILTRWEKPENYLWLTQLAGRFTFYRRTIFANEFLYNGRGPGNYDFC